MKFIQLFLSSFKKFQKKLLTAQQFILLHLIYLVGVGTTALFAKIVGKHFFIQKDTKTSWVNYKESLDAERMF
jgi:hypothetical protein